METDCSQAHQPGSSILGEFQVSLCEESMKRTASQIDEIVETKSKKKRRSSLSSHRRSITGGLVPAFQIETESCSQGSSESGSQKTSDDSQPVQETNANQPLRLPNPVNLQMDVIIDKMRHQISALDQECKKWVHLLEDSEQQEELSKLLALNLTLPVSDLPADVKELGMSKYITSKPLDLRSVHGRLEKLLLQYKFDKEACLQDLQLINETGEMFRSTNKYFQSHFSHIAEEVAGTDNPESGARTTDSRQTILNYQDCA